MSPIEALYKSTLEVYSIDSLRKISHFHMTQLHLKTLKIISKRLDTHYMLAYLQGLKPGMELDQTRKIYKMAVQSTDESAYMNRSYHIICIYVL